VNQKFEKPQSYTGKKQKWFTDFMKH
jgi:hypothetical protein